MSTTAGDQPAGDVEDLEAPQLEQTAEGTAGLLPRFRPSQKATSRQEREPRPPSPPQSPAEGPQAPGSAAGTGRSSPTSTEGPDEPEELVDPADLQAAIRQVVDISLVAVGQGLGELEKRAKQLPKIDERWTPTKQEREFVLEPAGRIARRHIHAPAAAMDTIDGCLIATGVVAFGMRAYLNIEALPEGQP